MTLRERARQELWASAGARCAIHGGRLVRDVAEVDAESDLGVEHQISRQSDAGIALPSAYFDSADNYILLCATDDQLVRQHSEWFTAETLRRQKTSHERLIANPPTLQLKFHVAVFVGATEPNVFLKLLNTEQTPVVIERVWFESSPPIEVVSPERPFPAEVGAGDLFETWILRNRLPGGKTLRPRARLRDGRIIEGVPNADVAPAGRVGGGGTFLETISAAVAEVDRTSGHKRWDAFVSYAHADSDGVVPELLAALKAARLRVWTDRDQLVLGSPLSQSIDEGVVGSRAGILVITPAYLQGRYWTAYEHISLTARQAGDRKFALISVLHDVSHDQLVSYSPYLAGLVYADTGKTTIERIASDIATALAPGAPA